MNSFFLCSFFRDFVLLAFACLPVHSFPYVKTSRPFCHSHHRHHRSLPESPFRLSMAFSSSSRAETSSNLRTTRRKKTKPQRTLYEVLGASPTASRSELKQKYVALAKQSHPDAQIKSKKNGGNQNSISMTGSDFSEIAAAWRVLSDQKLRKNYDRSLQAEQFTEELAASAEIWAERAAKTAAEGMDNVAMPFLRRTAATIFAGTQAAAQELGATQQSKQGEDNLVAEQAASAFQSAMEAARRAGKEIDSLELIEKAEKLEQKAQEETATAEGLLKEMERIKADRVQLALHITGSGLTAAEANRVMVEMNTTSNSSEYLDHLSLLDRARGKHTLTFEIDHLSSAELDFVEAQKDNAVTQQDYNDAVQQKIKVKSDLTSAMEEEKRLRKLLAEAEERTSLLAIQFEDTERSFVETEAVAKWSSYELERKSLHLEQQSEKVRTMLLEKQQLYQNAHQVGNSVSPNGGIGKPAASSPSGMDAVSSAPEVDNEKELASLKELRRKEGVLGEQRAKLLLSADRMRTRAEKLRINGRELEFQ